MRQLAKTGRVPSLGDGSHIQDGQGFILGVHPPALYAVARPNQEWKAAMWMALIDQCDRGAEKIGSMIDKAIADIKSGMTEGQTVRDLLVSTVGRPDVSHQIAAKIQGALPVVGSPTISDPSALWTAASSWGESHVVYWIANANEPVA